MSTIGLNKQTYSNLMITAKKVKHHDWKEVISECFANDPELLNEFHICAPCTLSEAVKDTLNVLNHNVHPDFTLYKIRLGTEVIGFFGIEMDGKFLTTFCIKKAFRTKDIIEQFWNIINEFIPGNFRTALYKRNTRAINFLLNNGGVEIQDFRYNGKDCVLIEFSWEDSEQAKELIGVIPNKN